ncbi:HEPN domain-containing protein [Candidatus Woesearchaeota archaeon]|nr:HEPN domain-containing protein [Candidatus Woesearchaeota archaeon]
MSEKLEKCFKEGEKGKERHKGLKKIDISEEKIKKHIEKAIHNYKAIIAFKKNGFSDWSASAAFYALYHLLLALLAKHGVESRNQSCTFAFIEELIEKGKISLDKNDLKEIFDKDITENIAHSNKILDLRENWQYSVKTALEEEEFVDMKARVKELFDKLRREIEK